MADDEIVMVRGCKSRAACSILLRGPNDYMLDEMDRSLHDALCIVKRVLESGRVVAGEPSTLEGFRVIIYHYLWTSES